MNKSEEIVVAKTINNDIKTKAQQDLIKKIRSEIEGLIVDEVNPYETVGEASAHNRAINIILNSLPSLQGDK